MALVTPDKKILLELLDKSRIFATAAKLVIRRGVEQDSLPAIDRRNILQILQVEQNMNSMIDLRANHMITERQKRLRSQKTNAS